MDGISFEQLRDLLLPGVLSIGRGKEPDLGCDFEKGDLVVTRRGVEVCRFLASELTDGSYKKLFNERVLKAFGGK